MDNKRSNQILFKRQPPTGAGDPWAALAGAVLIKAVDDARAGDHQAAAWLLEEGQIYLDGLGLDIDPDYLQAWIEKGCPGALKRRKKPVERLRLRESVRFPGKNASRRMVGDPRVHKLPVYSTDSFLLRKGGIKCVFTII